MWSEGVKTLQEENVNKEAKMITNKVFELFSKLIIVPSKSVSSFDEKNLKIYLKLAYEKREKQI